MSTILAAERLRYLTAAQRDTLELLFEGKRHAEVAAQLGRCVRTVDRWLSEALRILGVGSLVEAAATYGMLIRSNPPPSEPSAAEIAFRTAFSGLAVVDERGVWIAVNPAFARVLGYHESDLIGLEPCEVAYRDHRAPMKSYVRSLLREATPTRRVTFLWVHRCGATIALPAKTRLIRGSEGQIWGASAEFAIPSSWRKACRDHDARMS